MLVTPSASRDGALTLTVLSYDTDEVRAMEIVLARADAVYSATRPTRDSQGRTIRYFTIDRTEVAKVERHLRARFMGSGSSTFAYPEERGAIAYKCQEVTPDGFIADGCRGFLANDKFDAVVRGGLIAHRMGWPEGLASPGECTGPSKGEDPRHGWRRRDFGALSDPY